MTALATTEDTAAEYRAALARVKVGNMAVVEQAVGAALILGEKLAVMAQETEDPDIVRKAYDSFTRKAEVPEKAEQANKTAEVARAILQIVLDPNVPQEPPLKRAARRPLADIQDAVEVLTRRLPPEPPGPTLSAPADDSWGEAFA